MTDARTALIEIALAYPEAYLDHPWGEDVVKVKGKIFVFFGMPGGPGLDCGMKLPASSDFALMQPWATPTGYGLGRAGWVSCHFEPNQDPPIEILRQLIEESYRAVAPKRLAAQLDAR